MNEELTRADGIKAAEHGVKVVTSQLVSSYRDKPVFVSSLTGSVILPDFLRAPEFEFVMELPPLRSFTMTPYADAGFSSPDSHNAPKSISDQLINWTLGTIAMSDALDTVFEAYRRGDNWTWGGEPLLDGGGYFQFHLIDQAFLLTEHYGDRIQAELDSFAEALDVQVVRKVSHLSGKKLVLLRPKPSPSEGLSPELEESLDIGGRPILL